MIEGLAFFSNHLTNSSFFFFVILSLRRSSGQSILGSESAAPDSSPSEPSPSTPPGSSAMIHAVSTPAPYGAGAPAKKTVGDSQW